MARVPDYPELPLEDLSEDDLLYVVDGADGDRRLTAGTLARFVGDNLIAEGNLVQLDEEGHLPALDARNLVNLPGGEGGGSVDSVNGKIGPVELLVSDIPGAASVSVVEAEAEARIAADALKAPLESPAFTGTPTGITKAHVGLGNVDDVAADSLRDRTTHTGVQPLESVEGLPDELEGHDERITAVEEFFTEQAPFQPNTPTEITTGAVTPFKYITSDGLAAARAVHEVAPVIGDFQINGALGLSQIAPMTGDAQLLGAFNMAYPEMTLRLASVGATTLSFGPGITIPADLPQEGDPGEIDLTDTQILKMTVAKYSYGASVSTAVSDITISAAPTPAAPLFGAAALSPVPGADGQTFTATWSLTAGNPAPDMSFEWTYLGEVISGATAYQLVATSGDSGPYTCKITGTNTEGSDEVTVASHIGAPVPTLIGTPTVAFHLSGSAGTVSLDLPAGTQAGDWLQLDGVQQNASNTAIPPDFALIDAEIPRISSTAGESFRMSRAGRFATADDISAGAISGAAIRSYSTLILSAWRGVDLVEYDSDDVTSSASFTSTNTLAPPSVTRSRPCVLLALVAGGLGESWDGVGDAGVVASGWTKIGTVTVAGSAQQGRYLGTLMMRLWKHGVASPTPDFTVGGADSKTVRITVMSLSGPL